MRRLWVVLSLSALVVAVLLVLWLSLHPPGGPIKVPLSDAKLPAKGGIHNELKQPSGTIQPETPKEGRFWLDIRQAYKAVEPSQDFAFTLTNSRDTVVPTCA